MSPNQLEAAKQQSPTGQPHCVTDIVDKGVQYKIITVRDSDGALIRVKRPIKAEASAFECPPPRNKSDAETDPGQKQEESGPSPSVAVSDSKSSDIPTHADGTVSATAKATTSEQFVEKEKAIDMAEAQLQQKQMHCQKRLHRIRGSLICGLGTVLGSSIQHADFDVVDELHDSHDVAGDLEDGDIIDSDQSWSDEDEDDDGGGDEYDHTIDDKVELGHGEQDTDEKSLWSFY